MYFDHHVFAGNQLGKQPRDKMSFDAWRPNMTVDNQQKNDDMMFGDKIESPACSGTWNDWNGGTHVCLSSM